MAVIPCTNTPIVQGIVTFDPATFRTLYPEFTGLSDAQLNQAFALAELYVNNTCGSRVRNANLRETLSLSGVDDCDLKPAELDWCIAVVPANVLHLVRKGIG